MSGAGNMGGARGTAKGFGGDMKGLLDGGQFDISGFRDRMGDFRDRMGTLRGQMQQAFTQGQPGQSNASVSVNGQNMPNGMNNLDLSQLQSRLQDLGPDIQQRLQQGLAPLRRTGFPFSR
jgi:hypothetical protein